MIDSLVSTRCPVCSGQVAVKFFDAGEQPLATLAWPSSQADAQALPRNRLDYVQCPACTHVWNHAFRYEDIPYSKNPNRMFNSGGIWRGHLAQTRDLVLSKLPANPVVVEIGCGEGHFLRGLSEAVQGGRFLGFDPSASPENGIGVEFHARLFDPIRDTAANAPDVIIIRHVLEHLTDVSAFIEQLSWGAANLGKPCLLFAEVPCIDRVFETDRLADFFYEHVAQFTTESFSTLMKRGGKLLQVGHGYDGEVVYALVELGRSEVQRAHAGASAEFSQRSVTSRARIAEQLNVLANSGKTVAVWGGTGKAAAFLHHFGGDAKRFPLVVDSDRDKVGSFVPGTGQRIEFRDILKTQLVDVVVIPTQWRAKDILAEMGREGIVVDQVLIEHKGELIDFAQADHPYR